MVSDRAHGSVSAQAPGRVNLLGEHTDYNDGFVLPTAIPRTTEVVVERSRDRRFSVHAEDLRATAHFELHVRPEEQFARYVYGCVKELAAAGIEVPPLAFRVRSEVPIGVGLSSSAALEVATLRALRALLHLSIDDLEIARIAQRAEVIHAGVRCGIMDQMAASLAVPGVLLFIDTRTFEYRRVPVPEGAEIVVVDSGIARSLANSGYNQRRAECEAAAAALGVEALRDADVSMLGQLDELPRRRARHVITENTRVLEAASGVSAERFGALIRESHESLRGDFQVSTPDLDELVQLLDDQPGVLGARLTGAGFGGACVALCRSGVGHTAARTALARYAMREGREGRLLV